MDFNELIEAFYERYQRPQIDELTVGFSGIDPPLKQVEEEKDHEKKKNLLGGSDEDGHYHLTKEQLEELIRRFNETYPPSITAGQIVSTAAEESMTPYLVLGQDVRN